MTQGHVYVAMFGAFLEHPAGLGMAVLRRAQALAKANISTDILVDAYYPDYDRHTVGLMNSGRLGDKIKIRSMHQDLGSKGLYPIDVAYSSPLVQEYTHVTDTKDSQSCRGYDGDEYRYYVWSPNGKARFMDHMVRGKRVRREWFDEAGVVSKIELMNSENKPELIQYLRRDGSCYMEEIMEPASGKVRGIVLNLQNQPSLFFKNTVDLFAYWMQQFVLTDPKETNPVIISEYAGRRTAFERLEEQNSARIIYTVHNNHLAEPFDYGSGISPNHSYFMNHMSTFDDVVVLTHEQRLDLWKEFGYRDGIHVIPHHMSPATGVGPRDPLKVVMVGRFDKVKGQIPALGAFKDVIQKVPNARLELYGRGADLRRIQDEIVRLGLTDSASIVGFTEDSSQVFSEAAVSIVASQYEGFCLSLAESMAAGCVPVSYSFKYGPQDLIRPGVDGLLVKPGNVRDLADSITFLLLNTEIRNQMSKAAESIVDKIPESRLIDEWIELLGF